MNAGWSERCDGSILIRYLNRFNSCTRYDDTLILETVHGSHLYGLNTESSDLDVYRVYADNRKSNHYFVENMDITEHSMSAFLRQCVKGVPQALEAMFSPPEMCSVDRWEDFRLHYNCRSTTVLDTYRRTIENFIHRDTTYSLIHSIRLTHDLHDIQEYGRFNPQIDTDLREKLLELKMKG